MSQRKIMAKNKQVACWKCKKAKKLYRLLTTADRVLMVCQYCKGVLWWMSASYQSQQAQEEKTRNFYEQRENVPRRLPTLDEQEGGNA